MDCFQIQYLERKKYEDWSARNDFKYNTKIRITTSNVAYDILFTYEMLLEILEQKEKQKETVY